MLFHVCCELLLESLIDSGQDTSYLTTARQGGSLIATDAIWSGPWGSSFRHCEEGYSTYVPQVVDASWHKDDILFGSTKLALVHSVFSNFEKHMKLIHTDKLFATFVHKPCGLNLHQGSLIRGDGLFERKGCAHDQGLAIYFSDVGAI